jgi:carboxymethylenebutenolidase
MGSMIDFARPDGGKTKGYLATAGQAPGIVVIQEWWGLNDQICGVADRFARAGYNALARISKRAASPPSRTRPTI